MAWTPRERGMPISPQVRRALDQQGRCGVETVLCKGALLLHGLGFSWYNRSHTSASDQQDNPAGQADMPRCLPESLARLPGASLQQLLVPAPAGPGAGLQTCGLRV